ncbi:phosphoribosyltransferase [Plantactinospora sp. CA-294935]|uniref:phosphoribosyltransferase n=1 Tax=Plantactinospora sp. CA-294935 TaxID=3240012 RepID=UPI003D8F9FC3
MPDLTWPNVETLNAALAAGIRAANLRVNHIVAISRGGFVPARLLATALGVRRLSSIGVSYEDAGRMTPTMWAPPAGLLAADRVLLVEDAIESGRSAMYAAEQIRPRVEALFTAAYLRRPDSIAHLDFVVEVSAQLPRFPWE